MQSKYDIPIIGSGIGELTCGYILSKNGYKVAIFEQGAQFGGCLQTFKRRGVKFETGVHFIGSMGEGQILNRYFYYLSFYTSTPLTYSDYTGTKNGAAYGVMRDINAPRIAHRTKIPNLLLTGKSTNSHGIMGVIIGAIITCSEFLGRDFLWKQITTSNP